MRYFELHCANPHRLFTAASSFESKHFMGINQSAGIICKQIFRLRNFAHIQIQDIFSECFSPQNLVKSIQVFSTFVICSFPFPSVPTVYSFNKHFHSVENVRKLFGKQISSTERNPILVLFRYICPFILVQPFSSSMMVSQHYRNTHLVCLVKHWSCYGINRDVTNQNFFNVPVPVFFQAVHNLFVDFLIVTFMNLKGQALHFCIHATNNLNTYAIKVIVPKNVNLFHLKSSLLTYWLLISCCGYLPQSYCTTFHSKSKVVLKNFTITLEIANSLAHQLSSTH